MTHGPMSPRRHVAGSEPSDVPQERIGVLDVARGIAILGTLATNIWIFTDPGGIIGYLERPLPSLTGGLEQAVQTIARQLANGKFLGMLTLMFGVGLELQRRSARRRGRPWPGRYPWRASLLFLDGLLHYLLVVEFASCGPIAAVAAASAGSSWPGLALQGPTPASRPLKGRDQYDHQDQHRSPRSSASR